jgi:glycine cleavage system protein P-like pyridoxal-binding family
MDSAHFDIKKAMKDLASFDPLMSLPVITVKALVEFTRNSKAKTHAEYLTLLQELERMLKAPGRLI